MLADPTRQRHARQSAGPERDLVRRRAKLQMAWPTKQFGNWHTIYTPMNRWAKSGVLDRVFTQLQQAQIIRVKIEAVALDSTIVKVHPHVTGALK